MNGLLKSVCLLFLVTFCVYGQSGFVHSNGFKIADGSNQDLFLRGVGLGGWLVPEGYMLNTPGDWGPTLINNGIVDLIGEEKAKYFWDEYRKNYVAEADIARIAQWGFNSIRVPFHYNTFVLEGARMDSSGYQIVDQLIQWCKKYNLYIILDMHAAPGSQNGSSSISDGDGTARLWLETQYQDQTCRIWKQIAGRYTNETIIAGYDLINEPVLPSGVSGSDMRDFYVRLTDSIRIVDQNHMLIFEGKWWATQFDGLTPTWDDNMAYSFHKYWGETTFSTIKDYYNMSIAFQTPLWMGESGENSNTWYSETVRLLESYNISWCWWTHKKFEKINCPLSADLPAGYDQLQAYWEGSGAKPDASFAETVLMQMAENLKIDKCRYRPGVIPALFDPEFATTNKPVRTLNIPGFIPAVDYDLGVQDVAYHDSEYARYQHDPYVAHNEGYFYRNDGVDIEISEDPFASKYNVGWIDTGEWMKYTVNVNTAGAYKVNFFIATALDGTQFRLILDDSQGLTGVLTVPNTGGWQNWQQFAQDNVDIPAGKHVITFQVLTGGFNIKGFDFIGHGYNAISESGKKEEEIKLYPNPSYGKINLQIKTAAPTPVYLTIYNTLGQKVWSTREQSGANISKFNWNFTNHPKKRLANGLYFFRIKTRYSEKRGKLLLLKP